MRKQKSILDAQETGPASLQVTYNWHLSFIDNYWTSDNNASIFTPTLIKMAHTDAKIKQVHVTVSSSAIDFKLGE